MKKLYGILLLLITMSTVQSMDLGRDALIIGNMHALQTLGISVVVVRHCSSSQEVLKIIDRVYRKLSLQYHPDKNIDLPEDEKKQRVEKFQQIQNAAQHLRDQAEQLLSNCLVSEAAVKIKRNEFIGASMRFLAHLIGDMIVNGACVHIGQNIARKHNVSDRMFFASVSLVSLGICGTQFLKHRKPLRDHVKGSIFRTIALGVGYANFAIDSSVFVLREQLGLLFTQPIEFALLVQKFQNWQALSEMLRYQRNS